MKKILFIVVIFLIIIFNCFTVNANNKIDLCIVYEKGSYEKGDKVNISFDLPKFSELFEVIIRVDYDKDVFSPVVVNEEYYRLDNHSIFESFIVNKKINENTLYAELMKNDINDGYYSSYKNNLCSLEFNALSHIDNIEEFFTSSNVQVFLFDINHSLINYEIKLVKQIDAGFYNSTYEVNVYGEKINLDDVFYINNRIVGEYKILEEKIIDYNKLGSQILQVGVFDYLTGKYLSYSTIVVILDNEAPVINSKEYYDIKDIDLNNVDFIDYIDVTDNFDQNVSILLNYYNKEYEKIDNDVINSFKEELTLYVEYVAVDGSMNKSEEKIVKFNLIDTISPKIDVSDINIIDNELEEFEIMEFINVYDDLDKKPNVIITFYNSDLEVIDNYKEYLTVNNCCYLDVYGMDRFNNISDKKQVKISLIDTTSPIVSCDEFSYINDVELECFDFNALVSVSDNDVRKCNISYELYVNDEVCNEETFKNNLILGKKCVIKYFIYDYSLNFCGVSTNVLLNDTTPPEIKVNIENDKVYKELKIIEYEIIDNISKDLNIIILLDGNVYNKEEVMEGSHELYIEATDESGNKNIEVYSFVVSNKSFIGNVIDGNIKIKSSVIVVVVIICTLVIGIVKFRYNYHLNKKYKES